MAVKSILKSSVTNKKIVTPSTINIKIISKKLFKEKLITKIFKEHKPLPDIYLICLEKKGIPVSLNIAKILRLKGLNIVSDPLRRSMKAQNA